MAIVLALLIVGWLVAFALGAQAGFDNQSATKQSASQPSASAGNSLSAPASSYRSTASVS